MSPVPSPYRWDSHSVPPELELARPELLQATASQLRRGGSAVLLGGRGLGKSVFLRQLEVHLRSQEGVAVCLLEPPLVRTLPGALGDLARALGVPVRPGTQLVSAREVVDQLLYRQPELQSVILLYDGVDPFILGEEGRPGSLGPVWFDHLESVRRSVPRLGVLVAGGLGVYLLRQPLGSAFFSRTRLVKLPLLSAEELSRLAMPFAEQGNPLGSAVLEAIRSVSGGNPALVSYVLEHLWREEKPSPEAVESLATRFLREHPGFVHASLRWLSTAGLGEAPLRVLARLREAGGVVARGALLEAMGPEVEARLELRDVVDLLASAGLVRTEEEGSGVLRVYRVPSLLMRALDGEPTQHGTRE
jgi:hypothetical protein